MSTKTLHERTIATLVASNNSLRQVLIQRDIADRERLQKEAEAKEVAKQPPQRKAEPVDLERLESRRVSSWIERRLGCRLDEVSTKCTGAQFAVALSEAIPNGWPDNAAPPTEFISAPDEPEEIGETSLHKMLAAKLH